MYRFDLPQIQARIDRLRELTVTLGKEVVAQRRTEGLLLPLERRRYLDGLQDGLASLDAVRALEGAVKRVQTGPP